MNGVAFGGVVAFIFADLITFPLLANYRRFYGAASTWRLFVLLWLVMSVDGLLVNGLFHVVHLVPSSHHVRALSRDFPLDSTLVLNILATFVLIYEWWLARSPQVSSLGATGPDQVTYYFCSEGCRSTFLDGAPPPWRANQSS